jgi:DNA/RNA endonuclease G (NUC1)
VYLDSIPARLRGDCGETGASNVAATAVRSGVPGASLTGGRIVGDQSFLRYHLPWGTPAAPLTVSRAGYVVGFDPGIKLARWVGYKVNFHGPRRRQPDRYTPDPLIPEEAQVPSSAYARNPYDRGNLIRRLDLAEPDEPSAFYLSVVAPQADRMNQGVWVRIEDLATRASADADVWVLAGTAFLPAPGSNEVVTPKLDGNVPVPTHWFRIALRKRRNGPLEALSFLVPNDFTVGTDAESYLTSIQEIEGRTALRLLSDLPESDQHIKAARPALIWAIEQ